MTRINLVHPSELADQHLFAEFREIKMVPKALNRSLRASGMNANKLLARIPEKFTLNAGHVMFFYNKGAYLANRFDDLVKELDNRGYEYDKAAKFDAENFMALSPWNGDYIPDSDALAIIRKRISEKIAMKPHWYKYYGKSIY